MRLCYPHDVPRYGVEFTYRHSRLTPLLVVAAAVAFAVGWTLFVVVHGGSFVLYLPAVVAAVAAAITLTGARAAFMPSNWLLKSAQDGVYLKFRSYLNQHFGDREPTVVHLAPADIDGVRVSRERLTLPNRDGGDLRATLTHLDILLAQPATDLLHEPLDRERVRIHGSGWRGRARIDHPVRLVTPRTLRINWKASRPVAHAADLLGRRYGREEDVLVVHQPWSEQSPEDQEALILDLSERGELLTAMRLAQMRYDLDAGEARTLVNKLVRQPLEPRT